ncbi:MAG: hypothetical protein H6563_05105 [Lewinellaceae bacterium]|nr:hypothetical protein [Lewinellaceae bacterium]
MKASHQATSASEPQLFEGKFGRVCTCTLCLAVFPLIYIVGRVIVSLFG